MEWELSKENFQPLKRGRDIEKLDAAAALPPTPSKTTVEQQRRQALDAHNVKHSKMASQNCMIDFLAEFLSYNHSPPLSSDIQSLRFSSKYPCTGNSVRRYMITRETIHSSLGSGLTLSEPTK